MAASAVSIGLASLVAARFVTGVGVAAAMATLNTVVAEQANDQRRDLAITLQSTGFPLGGVLGAVCAYLIAGLSWRWVFGLGAALSTALTAAVFAWLPESLDFLIVRRPPGALARLNRLLAKLDAPRLTALPTFAGTRVDRGRARGRDVVLICACFFLLMFTFYFLTSWTPTLLTTYGLPAQLGVSGAVFMNLGGVAGDLVFAALTLRVAAARLSGPFLLAALAASIAFGFAPTTLAALMPLAFILGFLLFGAMASLFAALPTVFPAATRTGGTGLALGLGRIGAVVGPYAGGLLIAAHWSRPAYLVSMSAPLALTAAMTLLLAQRASGAAADP
jgi:MFS family permease